MKNLKQALLPSDELRMSTWLCPRAWVYKKEELKDEQDRKTGEEWVSEELSFLKTKEKS